MKVLVTGAAGFIGFHMSELLLKNNYTVEGVDNLNNYYDPNLKKDRLKILNRYNNFKFHFADIKDKSDIDRIFFEFMPNYVINLAAQAGVRYSIENPYAYIESNIVGFMNILEACRTYSVKHLIYASSSSVYGGNMVTPFSVNHNVDHPISLYAATKKSNELMVHAYSHLYGIPSTGLRFFTVYGPWGRPDMAYFSFTKDILEGNPIKVFNHGMMERDFTYIDDIINAIYKIMDKPPVAITQWNEEEGSLSSSFAPYKIYNIGNNSPVQLMKFINILEDKLEKKAEKIYMDMQPGDVLKTYADVSELEKDIGFKAVTTVEEGIGSFVEWYKKYYEVK